ncbi:molybdate transport system substrate-binding protein [Maricaulis salignorans]|uniref:Molybdate transport system substrate-binding protein n=1 Tax=Maricaulis salignorans TaxID=144026 RepID=A0A1G9LQ16_9PROT|nr:molybdate transport system substrate-binding protein [Maricaulis salignorans]
MAWTDQIRSIVSAGALALGWLFHPAPAAADQALIAVASNFNTTARALQTRFEQTGEHTVLITPGSTGRLYAQILHGAPFDVLLSADQETVNRLAAQGRTVSGTQFTYAVGHIALWSTNGSDTSGPIADRLREGRYRTLAIANPALAPYGAAAREALQALELWSPAQDRLVTGESIAAVQAMLITGNADLGVVPVSQFAGTDMSADPDYWAIPPHLYTPIRQDAVLTRHGQDNPAARAWLDFLASAEAREIISAHGYGVEE